MKRRGAHSHWNRWCAMLCVAACIASFPGGYAQSAANERTFAQSTSVIENALKGLQPYTSGKLPTLDGFAVPGERSLDRFERGFYQCTLRVNSGPSGRSIVHVSAKITAWYNGATPAQSGYQVLLSNGRLESDLLDRLEEALGNGSSPPLSNGAAKSVPAKAGASHGSATKSASAATGSMPDAPSSSASGQVFRMGKPAADREAPSVATQAAVVDRHVEALQTEAKNLQEILRNQSHPTNLVAVKEPETPVLATPVEGGKVLFLASAEDEFEMLDLNSNWVHVRISGLSRGWIERSHLEMDGESVPETAQMPAPAVPAPASAPAKAADTARYEVEHEEIGSFPAMWEPLRGKTVKIITVQPTLPTGGDAKAKLDFAKSLFEKEYKELMTGETTAAGLVVMFDSVDGGMLATTTPTLKQWKEGSLSDAALWRRCFVDPPEMLSGLIAQ
ncbi:MAG TPA: hypothetical protein VMB18_13265 [Terriglobales bacterium]|nr:hypothetical protein [Terriglobales bacterium]